MSMCINSVVVFLHVLPFYDDVQVETCGASGKYLRISKHCVTSPSFNISKELRT